MSQKTQSDIRWTATTPNGQQAVFHDPASGGGQYSTNFGEGTPGILEIMDCKGNTLAVLRGEFRCPTCGHREKLGPEPCHPF